MNFKVFMQSKRQFSTKRLKEIYPKSVVKKLIFKPKPKTTPKLNPTSSIKPSKNDSNSRFNPINIQMLSAELYRQIFDPDKHQEIPQKILEQSLGDFGKFGMNIKDNKPVPDVGFELPKLNGKDLEEHFFNIGEEQAGKYRELVHELLKKVPTKPKSWLFKSGWIRYVEDREPEPVDYPLEDCAVFDVEVCVNVGAAPVIATAVTSKAWYGWVSEDLINADGAQIQKQRYDLNDLIPFESTPLESGKNFSLNHQKPRVIIGHNVSYDRARIKEQYWIDRTGTRFIDTMSLHVCVSGVTSYQRAILKSKNESSEEDNHWKSRSSLNSLAEVYKLYCNDELEKETRNIFVEGSMLDVKKNFQSVMEYCSNDVSATFKVLKILFPMFLERFPHPVTLAGMLEMGTAYLPVNSNWERYLFESEQTFEDLENEVKLLLARKANDACQLFHKFQYQNDLWMWDQDWSIQELKVKKIKTKKNLENLDVPESEDEDFDLLTKKFFYLNQMKSLLPVKRPLLPGYPAWYRKLCLRRGTSEWKPGPQLISTSMQITPKLLHLTWEGYPLHYLRNQGWGFLVPFSTDLSLSQQIPLKNLIEKCPVQGHEKDSTYVENLTLPLIVKDVQENLARREYYSAKKPDKTQGKYQGTGIWCDVILEECCYFMKLPHKDGVSFRVGNPLAKDFLNKFSENVLSGDDGITERILAIARMLSYWRNNRDRINSQIVVWLKELPTRISPIPNVEYGAILPQVVVCGTLTRRAMEPTWMTASNAHLERIGSELRGLIQAPPGYKIVGADVDSQELWIASVIGDSSVGPTHGITPFGWMTLSGSKANGTDMHSVTAKAVGISRDHAKVINYARIYGAGQNFAERLLKQFNPSMSINEARNKAMKMFALTKGKRVFKIRDDYKEDFLDRDYSNWEAIKLAKAHGKGLKDMFHNPKWVGGTESAMFNRLEEIAGSPKPVTPFLKGRLSRALEPEDFSDDRFLPTRVNWVVQSGAVDFLHLMLVSMRWLMKNDARFVLSFHDEIRYLVPDEHKYKAALAMHITNLLVRAFCAKCLGLNDLPMSIAFFTSVEVDSVLRKECGHDCRTPSNPHGLEKGYGIALGESLDIYSALKKCKGIDFLQNVGGDQKEVRAK